VKEGNPNIDDKLPCVGMGEVQDALFFFPALIVKIRAYKQYTKYL